MTVLDYWGVADLTPGLWPFPPDDLLRVFDYDTASVPTSYASELGVGQTWDPDEAWQTVQVPAVGGVLQPQRIQVVDAASVPGTGVWKPKGRALRFEVRPYNPDTTGDVTDTGGFLASRAEVYDRHAVPGTTPAAGWADPPGSTRWWGWSFLFPTGHTFATDSTWELILQVKGYRGGSPPIALEINRNRLRLSAGGSTDDLGTITPGTWVNVNLGARLSTSATDGWVEAWRDGTQVVPRRAAATLDIVNSAVDPVYTKQGIYRSKDWTVTHVVWHGPLSIGASREAVQATPTAPTQPPADTTAPTTAMTAPASGATTTRTVAAEWSFNDG